MLWHSGTSAAPCAPRTQDAALRCTLLTRNCALLSQFVSDSDRSFEARTCGLSVDTLLDRSRCRRWTITADGISCGGGAGFALGLGSSSEFCPAPGSQRALSSSETGATLLDALVLEPAGSAAAPLGYQLRPTGSASVGPAAIAGGLGGSTASSVVVGKPLRYGIRRKLVLRRAGCFAAGSADTLGAAAAAGCRVAAAAPLLVPASALPATAAGFDDTGDRPGAASVAAGSSSAPDAEGRILRKHKHSNRVSMQSLAGYWTISVWRC